MISAAFFTLFISHIGVEVAPQMPIEFIPTSQLGSISDSLLMRCALGLA